MTPLAADIMSQIPAMTTISPRQIIYLEHGCTRLYAEAIQIIEERQMCWARPLLLVERVEGYMDKPSDRLSGQPPTIGLTDHWEEATGASMHVYDLEGGSDLLWPIDLFQLAVDTDLLSVLGYLYQGKTAQPCSEGQVRLRQFVQRLWDMHPTLPIL